MIFDKKFKIFFYFFYGKMGLEIMFYDVLDKKETILEQKNNNLLEGQNWQFCRGVNP